MPLLTLSSGMARGFRSRRIRGGNDAKTIFLSHFDETNGSTTIADISANPVNPTAVGGGAHSTAQAKFGSASWGPGSFQMSAAKFNSLTAFTFDWWGYNNLVFFNTNGAATYASLMVFPTVVYSSSNGVSWDILNSVSNGLTAPSNTWTYYAVVWTGTDLLFFQDGALTATVPWTLGIGSPNLSMFANQGSQNTGYSDELRISKVARWTSNFTPPKRAYS